MPRRKRKSNDVASAEDNDTNADISMESTTSSSSSSRPKSSSRRGSRKQKPDHTEELHIVHDGDDATGGDDDVQLMFSQQAPEPPQPLLPPKAAECVNLQNMNDATKEKAVTDLSRLLLFKALSGEPIDKLKCTKDVLADYKGTDGRITSAAFDEAKMRLHDVFGFKLGRVPKYMEKSLPAKYRDKMYYVINDVQDDPSGCHSRSLHAVHVDAAVERGLLMLVLALAFCKGTPRANGSRWISAEVLYRLLHGVDDTIPGEPPLNGKKGSSSLGGGPATPSSRFRNGGGLSNTPDVDALLEKYVAMDYLLREKEVQSGTAAAASTAGDASGIVYAMGPRAALEIGRRQIVYFCAEVLDEQPDPTMLAEIDDGNDEEEEEEGGEAGEDEYEEA